MVFAVRVDEINQGMDPKNEQMAHRYLVHTACQNSKSQYFLVTPKLLTGLYYHPDMVVHCIFTGPYITDNEEKRDRTFGGCVSAPLRASHSSKYAGNRKTEGL